MIIFETKEIVRNNSHLVWIFFCLAHSALPLPKKDWNQGFATNIAWIVSKILAKVQITGL